jgi:HPt (histidine-containing phosphotransfer) domain-containing protein
MIDPGVLDLAHLNDVYEGDQEGIKELLDIAIESAKEQLAAIDHALAGHSASEVRQAAHAIKGASLNIGAPESAKLAASLEDAAKSDDWSAIPDRAAALKAACARLAETVTNFNTP